MLKFLEDKRFFYVSAVLSIIVSVLASTVRVYNVINLFNRTLMISLLIAMIIFNRVEHKELMKVLTASFLQVVIINAVLEYSGIIEPIVGSIKNVTHLFDINVMSFRGVTLLISIVFLFILYINHFIVNFSGKASKVAINVSKIIVTLQMILLIIGKTALIVEINRNYPLYATVPSKLKLALILNGMPTIIYTLTVVSMESFINKEREEKDIK